MKYQFIRPNHLLSDYVKLYWILEIDDSYLTNNSQRIVPNGFPELIFYYGDPVSKQIEGNQVTQPRLLLCGQKNQYFDILSNGKIGIISVLFKPDGARFFFDIPSQELANNGYPLEFIAGVDVKELEEKLLNSKSNEDRINIIELFLLKRVAIKNIYDFRFMKECINKINFTKGMVSLDCLISNVCTTGKQLERKFLNYLGLPPKQFLKVVRFQNAIHIKQLKPMIKLTELGYEAGYYDQSHLINDFKSFSGLTPKEFFKCENAFSDYFSF